MEKQSLQNQMFSEIEDKKVFHQALKYSLEYLDEAFNRNVYPTEEALKNLSEFEEDLSNTQTNPSTILEQLKTYGAPATVSTIGGRYFGFVCGSTLPIGLAAKTLGTFWDQSPTMNVLSPITGKLESVVEKWMINLFDFPKTTAAGFVSGTSLANLCALAAARFHILKKQDWDINNQGLYNAPPIRIVTGRHAHSSVLKAIQLLGFGKQNIEWVDVDDQGRIIPELIPKLDAHTILILQAGNVNSGAFDDFEIICELAQKTDTWVHIDGAFGLWAGAVKSLKHLTKGAQKATSWAIDGHKTLNTPYDCGIVLCKHHEALTSALHTSGSYIVESKERDSMFYVPEMSRRSRIIELWAILKYLGKEGIDEMVLTMYQRATQFAQEIKELDGFYVDNDVVFNQVIVRCQTDKITELVLKKIQELRTCWLGGSEWHNKKVIRVSVCSWATTTEDISISVQSFKKALELSK